MLMGDPFFEQVVVGAAAVTNLRMAHELRLSDEGDAILQYMKVSPDADPELYKEACPSQRIPIGIPQVRMCEAVQSHQRGCQQS